MGKEKIKNILFTVAYNGANYSGWQRQGNSVGVQEIIEDAIFNAIGQKVEIFGSGRTDAGVHAVGQTFNTLLFFEKVNKLPLAINSYLPNDIRIMSAKTVPNDFHARYSAHSKTYIYNLCISQIESPFDYQTCEYIKYDLDIKAMQKGASFLVGKHNFKAFCSANTTVTDFEREIYSFSVIKIGGKIKFEVCGSGFLYNMVRIMVGTLVDVGRGKIRAEEILDIIKSQNRQHAGKTMPARGLCLKCVKY